MRSLTLFWLLFVTALSLMPIQYKFELGTTGKLHEIGHFGAFLIAAGLLCWNTRTAGQRLLRCSGALCLAFLLEAAEMFFFRNRFEWTDVVVDALGIVSGYAAVPLIRMLVTAIRSRPPLSEDR